MKSAALASAALLVAAAAAQPRGHMHARHLHAHKARHQLDDRAVVVTKTDWVTQTQTVVEYIDASTTIILPANAPALTNLPGAEDLFHHEPSSASATPSAPAVPSAQASSSSSAQLEASSSSSSAPASSEATSSAVPQQTSSAAPTSSAAQSTSAPPPPPPPASSTSSAVESSSSPAMVAQALVSPIIQAPPLPLSPTSSASPTPPPAQPTYPAQQAPAPTPTSAAPPSTGGGGSSSSGSGQFSGDITFYDIGLGSCGEDDSGQDMTSGIVAMPHEMMGLQSNGNSYCGKTITIWANGRSTTATVKDKCMGCTGASIDVSTKVFLDLFGSTDLGRGQCTWSFNN